MNLKTSYGGTSKNNIRKMLGKYKRNKMKILITFIIGLTLVFCLWKKI